MSVKWHILTIVVTHLNDNTRFCLSLQLILYMTASQFLRCSIISIFFITLQPLVSVQLSVLWQSVCRNVQFGESSTECMLFIYLLFFYLARTIPWRYRMSSSRDAWQDEHKQFHIKKKRERNGRGKQTHTLHTTIMLTWLLKKYIQNIWRNTHVDISGTQYFSPYIKMRTME